MCPTYMGVVRVNQDLFFTAFNGRSHEQCNQYYRILTVDVCLVLQLLYDVKPCYNVAGFQSGLQCDHALGSSHNIQDASAGHPLI
jgi:hypothetical protein